MLGTRKGHRQVHWNPGIANHFKIKSLSVTVTMNNFLQTYHLHKIPIDTMLTTARYMYNGSKFSKISYLVDGQTNSLIILVKCVVFREA